MSRFGRLMLLLFVAAIGGFAMLARRGGFPARPAPAPATTTNARPIVPVAGVARDRLADTWGQARAEGARAHHAIDIMAPRGTPVLAAMAGTVEKLFNSANGGRTVYVRRADRGWVDYYAHLDGYAAGLREGMAVRQGQPIGRVGATGDADPAAPHLHYEIKRMAPGERWDEGTDVDPYPILRGTGG